MSDQDFDFSDMVKINKFALPDECQEHASLFHQICEQEAEMRDKLNWAKDGYEYTLAKRELWYRTNWEESWGKMTDSSVKSNVLNDGDVRKAKERMFAAQKKLDIVVAAKNAMEHRKSMLNNLVSMLISGFFASPKGARMENRNAEGERQLRKNLNEEEEN